MNETLTMELQLYYGDLLNQIDTCFDYFEKSKLIKKINAVGLLLGISPIEPRFRLFDLIKK